MKKSFVFPLLALVIAIVFTACLKNDKPNCIPNPFQTDKAIIDSFRNYNPQYSYLTWNDSLDLAFGVTGGNGNRPQPNDNITFKAIESLMDGTIIDSATTPTSISLNAINLNSLDYYALSKLSEGGVATYVLPSSVYVGCQTIPGRYASIPGNSQLVYSYILLTVQSNATPSL